MPTRFEMTIARGDAVVVSPPEDQDLQEVALQQSDAKRRVFEHAVGIAAATVLLVVVWPTQRKRRREESWC